MRVISFLIKLMQTISLASSSGVGGLVRRARATAAISIDEAGFAKRHEYMTVMSGEVWVLHVGFGRRKSVVEDWCRRDRIGRQDRNNV